MKTKLFKYSQNNSGGSFDIDDKSGLGPKVWIEAADLTHANARAESIGIYFDGCEKGMDCPCCGDRWSEPWDENGSDEVEIDNQYDFDWHDTVYVHRIDNAIERIKAPEDARQFSRVRP